MSEQHSVTALFEGLCRGDEDAVTRFVERYFDKLVGLGRQTYCRKFGNVSRPIEDEEDAAQSALRSFCARMKDGRIRELRNRHELWGLLVKITICKLCDQRDRITAKKRGGPHISNAFDVGALDCIVDQLPGPAAQAELLDTYRVAIEKLDPELRQIAEMDLGGRTRAEIAESLELTERTVYRKLDIIREKWDQWFATFR